MEQTESTGPENRTTQRSGQERGNLEKEDAMKLFLHLGIVALVVLVCAGVAFGGSFDDAMLLAKNDKQQDLKNKNKQAKKKKPSSKSGDRIVVKDTDRVVVVLKDDKGNKKKIKATDMGRVVISGKGIDDYKIKNINDDKTRVVVNVDNVNRISTKSKKDIFLVRVNKKRHPRPRPRKPWYCNPGFEAYCQRFCGDVSPWKPCGHKRWGWGCDPRKLRMCKRCGFLQ
jgi:hypothetical protein